MEKLNETITKASKKLESHAFAEAEELYEEALKIQKGNAAALMGLSMVYNRTGRPQKAKDILSSIVKLLQPQKIQRGKKLIKKKLPSLAVQATAYAQLGMANQLLEDEKQALAMYKKAYACQASKELKYLIDTISNPKPKLSTQEKILHDVKMLLRLNRSNEAQHLLKIGIKKFPNDASLLHQMGMVYRKLGQSDKAFPYVQQAIIIDPEKALYYNDLGMLFYDKKNYTKAITFYKRAIAKEPKYAIAYSNLGISYKQLEKATEAIASYKKAIEIEPNFAAAHNNLGNLLRFLGNIEGAKWHLKKALELVPEYADAKKNLMEIM
jgi:tetratricopeptide (TPR) repeat protein